MTSNAPSAGMQRAQKIEVKGKEFIVIAQDEPYFTDVYDIIRRHECYKGRWTAEDEAAYERLTLRR